MKFHAWLNWRHRCIPMMALRQGQRVPMDLTALCDMVEAARLYLGDGQSVPVVIKLEYPDDVTYHVDRLQMELSGSSALVFDRLVIYGTLGKGTTCSGAEAAPAQPANEPRPENPERSEPSEVTEAERRELLER